MARKLKKYIGNLEVFLSAEEISNIITTDNRDKTVSFESLPLLVKALALVRCMQDKEFSNIEEALNYVYQKEKTNLRPVTVTDLFIWEQTPEGHAYWQCWYYKAIYEENMKRHGIKI